jgi:PilZ domain
MLDRRKGNDRRSTERFTVNIDIEWEGFVGKQTGTISDVSVTGCFVLCSGEVENGDYVKIHFPLTNGNTIVFQGEVCNHVFEIGFGIRFINLSEASSKYLSIRFATIKS